MKKFLLLAFCLLFGFTTTTTLAENTAETTTTAADSAVAANANEIDTLEWYIIGGPAYVVIAGGKFYADSSGSIQVSGVTIWDVEVEAAEGYNLLSSVIFIVGNKIVVSAEVALPYML